MTEDDGGLFAAFETRTGILLDVSHVIADGKPFVVLWIADGDKRYPVFDASFLPYFYVVPDGSESYEFLRQKLKRSATKALANDGYTEDSPYPLVTEEVTRKWYGKDQKVVKVTVREPGHIHLMKMAMRNTGGVKSLLEADIRFHRRWLVDKGVRPMSTVEMTVFPMRYKPDKQEALFLVDVKTVGPADLSKLRILSWDTEVWNKDGFPDVNDPFTILSGRTSTGEEILVTAVEPEHPTLKPNDHNICQAFVELWNTYDPDVCVTYNGDNFDWRQVRARFESNGIPLPTGRDGREIQFREGRNEDTTVRLVGRANVDLYRVAKRDLLEIKQKSLDAVAAHFKIKTYDGWTEIPPEDMWAWFLDQGACTTDPEKRCAECPTHPQPGNRKKLETYGREDARVTLELSRKLLPLQAALSRFTFIPLGEVAATPRGEQCEYYLIRRSQEIGQLVPNKPAWRGDADDDEEYEGATVLEPVPGLHRDATGFDFAALYPTIMEHYNISPETYAGVLESLMLLTGKTEEELAETHHILPALPPNPDTGQVTPRHCFLKEPDGFFRSVIRELKSERKARKNAMKAFNEFSDEYVVLDMEQTVVKILTNSMYGYTGWVRSRFFMVACAESVTAWGRWMILRLKEEAEKLGLTVVYGDTDSVFVIGPMDLKMKLVDWVNQNLPVMVEAKENYVRVFFPGPKKRYVGLYYAKKDDGTEVPVTVIKGLETKRGDWSPVSQAVQRECIKQILMNEDPDAAARFARETVKRLQKRDFKLSEVTLRKGLKRGVDEYESFQAHVEALKRAMAKDPNFTVNVGDKIAYIVLEKEREVIGRSKRGPKYGPEPALHQKTCVVQFWDGKTPIDMTYYIEKQVIPAALRLLDYYGYDDDYFLTGQEQNTLFGEEVANDA